MKPHNTVFNTNCLIGRKVNDPEVEADIKYYPFTVVAASGLVMSKFSFELCLERRMRFKTPRSAFWFGSFPNRTWLEGSAFLRGPNREHALKPRSNAERECK